MNAGKLTAMVLTAVAGAAGLGTTALKAWTAKSDTAPILNAAAAETEQLARMLRRKAEDDDRRFRALHLRVMECEDRFVNPMVGGSRLRRAYDAATMAAEPLPEVRELPRLR